MTKETESFILERIHDQWDPRITEFRRELYMELGADPGDLQLSLNYAKTMAHFAGFKKSIAEEFWKFGDTKWRQVQFDALECALVDGKVVSISGCRRYDKQMLRVAMHLYTLNKYRHSVRNIQFRIDGFFARHLEFAKSHGQIDCLFMTVYPHSTKLEAHVKNLGRRRISPDGGQMHYIHDLIFVPTPLSFHDVDQYFFLYKLNPNFEFSGMAPTPLL